MWPCCPACMFYCVSSFGYCANKQTNKQTITSAMHIFHLFQQLCKSRHISWHFGPFSILQNYFRFLPCYFRSEIIHQHHSVCLYDVAILASDVISGQFYAISHIPNPKWHLKSFSVLVLTTYFAFSALVAITAHLWAFQAIFCIYINTSGFEITLPV